MAEEIEQVQTPETNYIEVINQLKQSTVSKDEYNRVLNDNKLLAQSLATSKASPEEEDEPAIPTNEEITDLRKHLLGKDLSNLDFIKSALDLRDALLAQGQKDPFLPNHPDYVENEVDNFKVKQIAEGLRQMVNYSSGNTDLFNSEMKRCCK